MTDSEARRAARIEAAKRKAEADRIARELDSGASAMDVWTR